MSAGRSFSVEIVKSYSSSKSLDAGNARWAAIFTVFSKDKALLTVNAQRLRAERRQEGLLNSGVRRDALLTSEAGRSGVAAISTPIGRHADMERCIWLHRSNLEDEYEDD